jgi:hypothetical protein
MNHAEQAAPIHNSNQPIWDLVIADMRNRDEIGRERYKTPLQAFNGRDSLRDLQEELLDGLVYLKQHTIELADLRENLIEIRNLILSNPYDAKVFLHNIIDTHPALTETSLPQGASKSSFNDLVRPTG